MPTLADVSSDVIHQILASVSDFKSLRSLLLTSKPFHDTFEAHPQGILRDIAFNKVGAALPQALRLVRCEAAGYRNKDVAELPSEQDVMVQPIITRREARALAENAQVAYDLEDLFSQRYTLYFSLATGL